MSIPNSLTIPSPIFYPFVNISSFSKSDPATSFLGIYPVKNIIQKDTCTPIFFAVLFTMKHCKLGYFYNLNVHQQRNQ